MIHFGKYNVIDTPEKLKRLDKYLMDGDKPRFDYIAYDTETNGTTMHRSTVVGFSISTDQDSGFYIPILIWKPDKDSFKIRTKDKVKIESHMEGRLYCPWTDEYFDEFVTPQEFDLRKRFPLIPALMKRWLTSVKLFMWNAPFDVNMTWISTGVDLKESLFLDGSLLVHALDENHRVGLKDNAEKYKDALGINPHQQAAIEKRELLGSILANGGNKAGEVWRASLEPQGKYACADTFFTFGICKAAMLEFTQQFGRRGLEWFFKKEVMPLCKEVICDMKHDGIYTDVPYFEILLVDTQKKMHDLEDQIHEALEKDGLLEGFNVGTSIDDAVSQQAIIKHIIGLEDRNIPINPKTGKPSIAKGVVKKVHEEDPHWIWEVILGEQEIKYSDAKIERIKKEIYVKKLNAGKEAERKPLKRYRFNIGSDTHLRWLFCEKLGMDAKKLPQTDSAEPEKGKVIPSMAADVLEEHMLPNWKWVSTLLSYKKLLKMESTYIRPVLVLNIDGWMYVDLKQNGTTSGRFAGGGGYNMQNLPRVDDELDWLESCEKCDSKNVEIIQEIAVMADCKCKECGHIKKDIPRPSAIKAGFIAPPGYKIINADYASLEPRCFAFMSNDEALKEVYVLDLDLYSKVYCDMFDSSNEFSASEKDDNYLKKAAPSKRKFIKPIVLAIPYGSEAYQVSTMIDAYEEKVDEEGEIQKVPDFAEGQRIIDMYLDTFPELKKYMHEQEEKAATLGYVESIIGRRRHLPNAKAIADVLKENGVSWEDLRWATRKQLEGEEVSFTSKKTKKAVYLSADMLEEIRVATGVTKEKIKEKNGWQFAKYLLKQDLNNAKNMPIQSLAGHIANMGMLITKRLFREHNINARVANQVHDEIMCYAKIEHADKAAELLQSGMEKNEYTALLDIPMLAEPEICDTLKEAK